MSYYNEADYTIIKWLSIEKVKGQFELTYFEPFDDGDEDYQDVHTFSVTAP